jgi:hypothetical protein
MTSMTEQTVLIHLNITVESNDRTIASAYEAARQYLRRYNIPVDDIADMEVI